MNVREYRWWLVVWVSLVEFAMIPYLWQSQKQDIFLLFAIGLISVSILIILLMAIDKLDAIHRERQISRYIIQLEPYSGDLQYLKEQLAEIQSKSVVFRLGRTLNESKAILLKDMIDNLKEQE